MAKIGWIQPQHQMPPGRREMASGASLVGDNCASGFPSPAQARDALRGDPIRENPSVMSKSDRRYGKNSSHGEQPARLHADALYSANPAQPGHKPAEPAITHGVGHVLNGSGNAREFKYPDQSNTGKTTGGLHDPHASTAHQRDGMRSK